MATKSRKQRKAATAKLTRVARAIEPRKGSIAYRKPPAGYDRVGDHVVSLADVKKATAAVRKLAGWSEHDAQGVVWSVLHRRGKRLAGKDLAHAAVSKAIELDGAYGPRNRDAYRQAH